MTFISTQEDVPDEEPTGIFREVTRCYQCGAFSHIAELYCTCCGHRMKVPGDEGSFCLRCGTELLTDLANYCHTCGEKQEPKASPP